MMKHQAQIAGLTGPHQRPAIEAIGLALALGLVWTALFTGVLSPRFARYPVETLMIPPLVWAAYRFSLRVAGLAVAGLMVIVVVATIAGKGPFAVGSAFGSGLSAGFFVYICASTTMVLATAVRDHAVVEGRLKRLAQTDGLTGLANHRTFVSALGAEVARAGRGGGVFSIVAFDLDRLKAINDTRGHVAGNEAICRVADVLRRTCREVDLPARVGGDEFLVLLPDTDRLAAVSVIERVCGSLERSVHQVAVRVSWGLATYPFDGMTADALVVAADRQMYADKSRYANRTRPRPATRHYDLPPVIIPQAQRRNAS